MNRKPTPTATHRPQQAAYCYAACFATVCGMQLRDLQQPVDASATRSLYSLCAGAHYVIIESDSAMWHCSSMEIEKKNDCLIK